MQLFRQQPADLAIIDVIMPEKDGLDTIQEMRREDPKVKIIAISGGGGTGKDALLSVAKDLGAQRVFVKPFSPTDILEATRELLTDRSASSSTAASA
jgi:DNA-binding response OmpR family regulator